MLDVEESKEKSWVKVGSLLEDFKQSQAKPHGAISLFANSHVENKIFQEEKNAFIQDIIIFQAFPCEKGQTVSPFQSSQKNL